MRVYLWFAITILLAFFLTVLPLPSWFQWMRPDWLLLMIIFWCVSAPNATNIAIAWLVGLLMDLLTGTVLGMHAMLFVLFAYVVLKLNRRVRSFPIIQQMLIVLVLTAFYLLLQYILLNITNSAPHSWLYWVPMFLNAILWPWLCLLLQEIVEKYQIST